MKKRILSLVLCICLLVTSLPAAFAEEVGLDAASVVDAEPPQEAPEVPEPPATEPPAEEPPATEAPATEAPATEAPATEPPATEPPVEEAPAEGGEQPALTLSPLADVPLGQAFAVAYSYAGEGELRFAWQRLDPSDVAEGMSDEEIEALWATVAEGPELLVEAYPGDGVLYRCVVTDGALTAVSNPARVLLEETPGEAGGSEGAEATAPEEEPQPEAAAPDAHLAVSVSATEGGFFALAEYDGALPLAYSWQYLEGEDWLTLDGAASELLLAADAVEGRAHRAVVTDGTVTAVSNEAWLPEIEAVPMTIAENEIASGECGEGIKWVLTNDGTLSITGVGPMADYAANYNQPWWNQQSQITKVTVGSGVTRIGNRAFGGCGNLASVEIPESVTAIGDGAFTDCKTLTGLTLPVQLETIGDSAFNGCQALTGLTFPKQLQTIGNYAFRDCDGLKGELRLPDGLREVGDSAFSNCDGITEVYIPTSVTSVGSYAFYCANLEKATIPGCVISGTDTSLARGTLPYVFGYLDHLAQVVIQDGVETIGNNAFVGANRLSGYDSLVSVEIPVSVTSIGNYAFRGCKSLTELTLPERLETIGDGAFDGCQALTGLTFPKQLQTIGRSAFHDCDGLKGELRLPDGLREIGGSAFSYCDGITEVYIPTSVTSVGSDAFNCANLEKATIPGCVISGADQTIFTPGRFRYAFGSLTQPIQVVIQDGVETIGNYAFEGSSLASVEIPESVTTIGEMAFNGCQALTGLTFPKQLQTIGDYAFRDCDGLKGELRLPDGLREVGDSAFSNCDGITEVYIPTSVTSVGSYAFYCANLEKATIPGCVISGADQNFSPGTFYYAFGLLTHLTQVVIQDGVETIGKNAFTGNGGGYDSLESVEIPESVTSIGEVAFRHCGGLTNLTFPKQLKTIGDSAFEQCDGLTGELRLPEGLREIGGRAFSMCNWITEVYIPASVTNVGSSAFSYETNLKKATIPGCIISGADQIGSQGTFYYAFGSLTHLTQVVILDGVETIGKFAFEDYDSLESIEIPESVTSIEERAFRHCGGLANLTFPKQLKTIGDSAFEQCDGLTGELRLPEGLREIGKSAFSWCDGIAEVYIPASVTSVGNNAFAYGDLEKVTIPGCVISGADQDHSLGTFYYVFSASNAHLTQIVIQDGVGTIGKYAFAEGGRGYRMLESIEIPNSVTSIADDAFDDPSRYPDLVLRVGRSSYADFWAGEHGFAVEYVVRPDEEIHIRFADGVDQTALVGVKLMFTSDAQSTETTLDGREQYSFYVSAGAQATVALQNAYGDVLFEQSCAGGKDVVIDKLPALANFRLSVYAGGAAADDKLSVTWTRDGAPYATGANLNCVPVGTKLNAALSLDVELQRLYRIPEGFRWTAGTDASSRRIDLVAFVQRELRGTVVSGGQPVSGATLALSQTLNGIHASTASATTDASGAFTLKAYDCPAVVTVSAFGYESRTIELAADGTLGEIELTKSSGEQVALYLSTRSAVRAGETAETQSLYALDGIYFEIYDVTAGSELTGFAQSGTILTLPGGVGENHRLRITAKDANGKYADATAEVTTASNVQLSAEFLLQELGGVEVSVAKADAPANVLLYDGDGALARTQSLDGAGTVRISPLADGSYAAVLMADSVLLGAPVSLTALGELGLVAGKDYARADVKVAAGVIAECGFDSVPALDETRFYYTDPAKTSLTVNKSSMTLGSRFTLRATAEFKPEYAGRVRNVQWIFELPKGSEYIDGTLSVGGVVTPSFTNRDNRITLSSVDDPARIVRLCANAVKEGELRAAAYLCFELDGATVMQPVGAAKITVGELTIDVPKFTNETAITARGMAPVNSSVAVYDNDVLVGEAKPQWNGAWTVNFELYKPYTRSKHQIYAKITMPSGAVLRTRTSELTYQYMGDVARPSRVTMYNIDMYHHQNEIVFDFLHPENSTGESYLFYPGVFPTFTFVIEFEGGDLSKLSDVKLNVEMSDGSVRTLDAVFDAQKNYYVATTEIKNYYAPVNVSVSYLYDSEAYYSEEEMDDIQAKLEGVEGGRIEEEDVEDIESLYSEDFRLPKIDISDLEDASPEDIAEIEAINAQIDAYNQSLDAMYAESEEFVSMVEAYETLQKDLQDFIGTCQIDDESYKLTGGDIEIDAGPLSMPDTLELNAGEMDAWLAENNWALCLSSNELPKISSEQAEKIYTYSNALLYRIDFQGNEMQMEVWAPERLLVHYPQTSVASEIAQISIPASLQAAPIANISNSDRKSGKLKTFFKEGVQDKLAKLQDEISLVGSYASQAVGVDQVVDAVGNKVAGTLENFASGAREYASGLEHSLKSWESKPIGAVRNRVVEELSRDFKTASSMATRSSAAATKIVKSAIPAIKGFGNGLGVLGLGLDIWGFIDALKLEREYKNDNSPAAEELRSLARLKQGLHLLSLGTSIPWVLVTLIAGVSALPACIVVSMVVLGLAYASGGYLIDKKIDEKKAILEKEHAGPHKVPIQDPSGYIYEAVASNRLSGVEVTCYQKRTEYDIYDEPQEIIEKWDANPYDQINPQITSAGGEYAWDVPDGEWQVEAKLEGYEDGKSDWMPVPPPQLDVNIGLVSMAAPTLSAVTAAPGAVEFRFTKYMRTDALKGAAKVYVNDEKVAGSIEWIDDEANPKNPSEIFVRSVRFVPAAPLADGASAEVRVSTAARSYAGVAPASELRMSATVTAIPDELIADAEVTLAYGGSGEIRLRAVPAEAARGKKVTVHAISDVMIALRETQVTLDANGCATVHVTGGLAGETLVNFSLDGTRLEAQTAVRIDLPCDHAYAAAVRERAQVTYSDAGDGLNHRVTGTQTVRMYCPDCGQYVDGMFDGVTYPYSEPLSETEAHAGDGNGNCALCGAELHAKKLNAANLSLGLNEIRSPGATVLPEGAPEEIVCTSSNAKIVSVTEDGMLKGVKKGSAKVTIKAGSLSKKITVTVKAAPKAVTLNAKQLTLGVEESYTLKAKLTKNTASAVTWTSSAPDVLRVEDGVLHPLAPGVAEVTATAFNGVASDPCVVTVLAAPKKPTLNQRELTLAVGMTEQLKCALSPENAGGALSYTSENEKFVTVTSAGLIKAVKAKSAPIAVTVETYNGRKDVCYVTVVSAPTKVKLNKTKATLGANDVLRLSATLTPTNTVSTLIWSSSNTKVATVDKNGVVTATGKTGSAKITVKTFNKKSATCTVTVKAAPTDISLNETEKALGVGESFALKATLTKNGAVGTVTWTSSSSCVSVDAAGNVTANRVGAAVVTGTTHNGHAASCAVTVKPAPRAVTLNQHELTLAAGMSDESLAYSYAPADAAGAASYTSADKKYVTVTSEGKIKAVKATKAPVAVTVETYNGWKDVCYVTVVAAPTKVTLLNKVTKLGVDETWQLGAQVMSGKLDTTDTAEYSFKSSKSSVVEVNPETGALKALKTGSAKITVSTYNKKSASVTITVSAAPTEVTLNQSEVTLGSGETATLKATLSPTKSYGNVTWTSTDEDVVKVSAGKLTAGEKQGTAKVTVSVYNSQTPEAPLTASCTVTVNAAPNRGNTDLAPKKLKIGVGESVATELVYRGSSGAVTGYKSSSTKTATVSKAGVIKGVKAGKATITAVTYNDKQLSKEEKVQVEIEVVKAPTKLTFTNAPEEKVLHVGETWKPEFKIEGYGGDDLTGVVNAFISSNKKYAVFEDGVLTAKAPGSVKITCKTYNGKSVAVTLTVKAAE